MGFHSSDYTNVQSESLEDWITFVCEKDSEFAIRLNDIVESLGYNYFPHGYHYGYEDYEKEDCRLGRVVGNVYVINYDGDTYFEFDSGEEIAAPKEMVFEIEGFGSSSETDADVTGRVGVFYFADFADNTRHCVRYANVISGWNVSEDGKYVFPDSCDSIDSEKANKNYDEIGFMYIDQKYISRTLCQYDGENFNQLIDKYSELIQFIEKFSIESASYYDDVIEAHNEENIAIREAEEEAKKKEREEKEYWENKIPEVGMTKEEVLKTSWGSPDHKNITTYTSGTHEQWVYSSSRYVYFDDGIVTSVSQRE